MPAANLQLTLSVFFTLGSLLTTMYFFFPSEYSGKICEVLAMIYDCGPDLLRTLLSKIK